MCQLMILSFSGPTAGKFGGDLVTVCPKGQVPNTNRYGGSGSSSCGKCPSHQFAVNNQCKNCPVNQLQDSNGYSCRCKLHYHGSDCKSKHAVCTLFH